MMEMYVRTEETKSRSGESLLFVIVDVDDISQVSYFFTLWSGTSLHGESCGVSPVSSLTSSASTSSILQTQPQVSRQVSPHLHTSSIMVSQQEIVTLKIFISSICNSAFSKEKALVLRHLL